MWQRTCHSRADIRIQNVNVYGKVPMCGGCGPVGGLGNDPSYMAAFAAEARCCDSVDTLHKRIGGAEKLK